MADAAQLSSLADETPEGRSIVVLAKEKYGLRGRELASHEAVFVPFTAQTRMSGVNLDGREIRKGAVDAIVKYLEQHGTALPKEVQASVEQIARSGGTPLVVAENQRRARRDSSEGHRQRRHARALRSTARHGNPDRDDHRRQSADRGGDCARSRRRRLSRAGHAERQDGPDQARAGAKANWSR